MAISVGAIPLAARANGSSHAFEGTWSFVSMLVLGVTASPTAHSEDDLAEATDILMLTRRDAAEQRMLLGGVRARVEVAFAKLWAKFLDRIYTSSSLGLWNTIKLKLLHHNLVATGRLTT